MTLLYTNLRYNEVCYYRDCTVHVLSTHYNLSLLINIVCNVEGP